MTTDRRPTSGLIHTFWKISNGHNSATRQPIPFMFVLGGVFGDGGSNGAISGWIKFKMAVGGDIGKLQMAISDVLCDSLYVCTQTILCRRSLIYNDGDSKLISFHFCIPWPTHGIQRKNKKQILRNSRENNARGVHIRLVTI